MMASRRFLVCIVGLALLVSLIGNKVVRSSDCQYVACDLSFASQMRIGGACNDDCYVIAMDQCNDQDSCSKDSDCVAGNIGCDDSTNTEGCNTPGGWPNCSYDPAHWCQPKRKYKGVCNIPNLSCVFLASEYGLCNHLSTQWIRQCGW